MLQHFIHLPQAFLCEEKKTKAYFYANYQLINPYFFLNHVH